jgi:hypothetical protein
LKHYIELTELISENPVESASSRLERAGCLHHRPAPSLGPTMFVRPKRLQDQEQLPRIGQSAFLNANQQIL